MPGDKTAKPGDKTAEPRDSTAMLRDSPEMLGGSTPVGANAPAILVQAGLATAFLLVSVIGRGTKVEEVYLILLDTQLLVYFIPFLYLFASFLIHRSKGGASDDVTLAPGGKFGGWIIGISGFGVTLFAMIVAMIPPTSSANRWMFFLKVIGGAFAFVAVGGIIYLKAQAAKV